MKSTFALVWVATLVACGNDPVHHLADAPSGGGDGPAPQDAAIDGAGVHDALPDTAPTPPMITTFAAPASGCTGATITLAYAFSGGSGVITPGNLVVAAGAGTQQVVLAQGTTYTLTVTGSGSPAIATADVGALPSPDGTFAGLFTARQGETATLAVPSSSGATYAWSVLTGNASITTGGATNQITYAVSAAAVAGSDVALQATITGSNTCTTTVVRHLPLHCGLPTTISLDRTVGGGAIAYLPSSSTRAPAINATGDLWTPYLVYQAAISGFVVDFTRRATGTWGAPASSPSPLSAAGARVYDARVATDTAGDTVVAWTQTTDFNTYTAKLRAYDATTTTWSNVIDVGADVIDQSTPIYVVMNQATGVATIVWEGGPFSNPIPHLRTYKVSTGVLGPDTPVRAAPANAIGPDLMDLDARVNAAGDGMIAWFEKNASTGDFALYTLHLTGGVPDTSGSAFAIQTIVAGTQTYTTDPLNQYSALGVSPDTPFGMLGVASNGNAAIAWHVYNGLSSATLKAQLFVRRYTGGAWGPIETIASSANADWPFVDVAIDDAGDTMVVSVGAGYQLFVGLAGQAWATPIVLAAAGHAPQPYLAMNSATGQALVTWFEGNGTRGVVRGAMWDPVTHVLSAGFTIDDPTQGSSLAGRPLLDPGGTATVVYLQTPTTLPMGATSNTNRVEYAVTCQ